MEGLADCEGDDARPGSLRMRLRSCLSRRADLRKGYMVLEEDMTMPLDEFARKFGREDGEPEYAATRIAPKVTILTVVQPLSPEFLLPAFRRYACQIHPHAD